MAERAIERIVTDCEHWWRGTGVRPGTAAEMGAELRSHLVDASAAGKSPSEVVGDDLGAFAEEWASEFRPPVAVSGWIPPSERRPTTTYDRRWMWGTIGVLGLAFAAATILAPKEGSMDTWQWIWVAAAVVLAIGELLTAGFFLLPFAVGAASAAILAFLGVSPVIQLLAFTFMSIAFLIVLQRFARREEEAEPQAVGAKRYEGSLAVVAIPVNRLTGTGMVRMETEEWRATTDLDTEIPTGVEVRVLEVRGTRLVVEPIRPGAGEPRRPEI